LRTAEAVALGEQGAVGGGGGAAFSGCFCAAKIFKFSLVLVKLGKK